MTNDGMTDAERWRAFMELVRPGLEGRLADDGRVEGDTRPDGTLTRIAERTGTDKVSNCYIYERYLASIRLQPLNLLEIGIGGADSPTLGGDSLRMWKEYLPNSAVHGIDLHDKSFCREKRISTYQGSQDDVSFLTRVADQIGEIDIVIDDGSHFSPHVITSFNVLFPRLNSGGLYVVEDIGTSYWVEHMGSQDFLDPSTSMFFFKRLADGIMYPFTRMTYPWTYADMNTASVHFYPNMVFVTKK